MSGLKLTLAEARDHLGDLTFLSLDDLDVQAVEVDAAGALWAALQGVAATDVQGAAAARQEVLNDAAFLVALSLPATRLVDHLRQEDWSIFDRSETDGNEVWALAVLALAEAAMLAMGDFASRRPMRAFDVQGVSGSIGMMN